MEIKRHKKVQVVVIDSKNRDELLLLQTKEDRGFHWQNITGSVEAGEDYSDAAVRELEEESGLIGEVHELYLKFEFLDRWKKNVIEKAYVALVSKTRDIRLNEQEHQSFKWMKFKDVSRESFGHESNWLSFLEVREWLEKNT